LLVLCAAAYGGSFACNKIAAEAGIPPAGYSFWQSLGGGVLMWLLGAARGVTPGWSWAHVRGYLAVGALGISLPVAVLTYVAPELPSGIVTLVLALSPPVTYLLSILTGIDRARTFGLLGIVFGLAGIAVLVGPTTALPDRAAVGWFLLALIAPVLFASSNISAALLRPPASDPVAFGSGVLFGAAVVILPIMLALGQTYVPGISAGDAALGIALLINCIVVYLFLEVIRMAGPTFFAQFNYLAVLAAIGWGAALFGERLGLGVRVALALMAVGVVLTTRKDKEAPAA
jgi:drug/metabolite transporter (DMT)-like permease